MHFWSSCLHPLSARMLGRQASHTQSSALLRVRPGATPPDPASISVNLIVLHTVCAQLPDSLSSMESPPNFLLTLSIGFHFPFFSHLCSDKAITLWCSGQGSWKCFSSLPGLPTLPQGRSANRVQPCCESMYVHCCCPLSAVVFGCRVLPTVGPCLLEQDSASW